MTHFDVFNGDADGLCALHQLRLAFPKASTLITGTKREIALLQRVCAEADDSITVLDLWVNANRLPLEALLNGGVRVEYIDHHVCETLPAHPLLMALVDSDPQICTAMLVDRLLNGRFRPWAIVGAYGDNLCRSARRLANSMNLASSDRLALRRLGIQMNYNAYGESTEDLIIHPADLYRILHRYTDPLAFIRAERLPALIGATMEEDLSSASKVPPIAYGAGGTLTLLPEAAWSRRVSGTLANALARSEPSLAHAVITPRRDGYLTVSVRAPLHHMRGADALCARFAHGGGRPAAAGIDSLPESELDQFIQQFTQAFSTPTQRISG